MVTGAFQTAALPSDATEVEVVCFPVADKQLSRRLESEVFRLKPSVICFCLSALERSLHVRIMQTLFSLAASVT